MLCSHGLLFPPLDWLQEQGPTLSLSIAANLFSPLIPARARAEDLPTNPPRTLSRFFMTACDTRD